jgi:redox-sensing transcriptional repressor
MGQALLDNTELETTVFKIAAGFDSSVNRTEILHAIFPLHPTTMLEQVIREEGIRYAILTVEPAEAQPTAARLVSCGIRGIVNYTPCVLSVPPSVRVENVSLLTALETLSLCAGDQQEN